MATIIWVLLSVVMLIALDILSFALRRKGWRRFVSTFLLLSIQIVLTEFLLGIATLLTRELIILVNILISLAILLYTTKTFNVDIFAKYYKSTVANIINSWKLWRKDYLFVILFILASLILLWISFLAFIFPATDFDGNAYHLTFIANAIQNHDIYDVSTSLKWLNGYPKGGELLQMWGVIVPHNDIFVDLAQLPFIILGVISLYEISLILGVKKRDARFVALIYVFIPIVLNQIKTAYVDVMLCSLFFAALAMVLQKKITKLDIFLLGTIYSLILSIKFTGIILIITTLPFFIYQLYIKNGKVFKGRIGTYIKQLGLLLIPLTFAAYWYVKNLVVYGTPLYPFGFKMFGFSIFPGKTFQEFAADAISSQSVFPQESLKKIWFVWTEQKDWWGCFYNYDSNYTGLGPIWFIILIPAIIVALLFAFKYKKYRYLYVSIAIILTFLIYPSNYYSRYTLFIVGFGIISLGIVFSIISTKLSNLVKGIVIILSLLVISTNFTLCNYSPLIIKEQIRTFINRSGPGKAYENSIGPAYIFLQSSIKDGETVVYDSSPYFIYALWKPGFTNRVIYVSENSPTEWLNKINVNNARFVFTSIGSKEHQWSAKDLNLKSIYKDSQYEIFQVHN